MRHLAWIALVAAAAGSLAGFGVLELVTGSERWAQSIGGVQIEVTADRRLYPLRGVIAALAAGTVVAAVVSYALARAVPVTPRRRR